jgi:thiosulfate reductase cytochrome b subunit
MSDPSQIDQDQNRVERPLADDSHTAIRDAASLDVMAGPEDSNNSEGSEIIPRAIDHASGESAAAVSSPAAVEKIYRHRAPVRIAHWLNAICIPILIMSGLQIFNAHQALYWGDRSDRDRPLLSIRAMRAENGEIKGVTTVLGYAFETTGVLGFSSGSARGFPSWATIPSGKWLAMGRQWHLFFAWVFILNGVFFALYAVVSRHVWRDLFPKLTDLRGLGRVLMNHLTFRHPHGDEARHYNVMQKLTYTGVIFGLAPLIVLTGLTMSPALDAAYPGLLSLFGGRQSARTIHFLACVGLIAFIAVHLLMVATTGLRNNIRSMITGWFHVTSAHKVRDEQ